MRGAMLVIGLAVAGAVGGLVLLVRALPPRAEDVPEAAVTIVPRSRPVVAPEPPASSAPQVPDTSTEAERRAAADAVNEFGLELFRRLSEQEKGNVLFSPYSLVTALAMTYAGARGETAAEMARVLRVAGLGDRLHPAMDGLTRRLCEGTQPVTHVANALWGQRGLAFKPAFLQLTRDYYRGGFQETDFRNPDTALEEVNGWVREHTRNKISNLLTRRQVGNNMRLILANAIHVDAQWRTPFSHHRTKPGPFMLSTGKQVEVPFMHLIHDFRYVEIDGLQLVELPYRQSNLSMILLLPEPKRDVKWLSTILTNERLRVWLQRCAVRRVDLTVPRFKYATEYALNGLLSSAGLHQPFSDDADFGGITCSCPLRIASVLQKTAITVNETGTEAAASTGVGMAGMYFRPIAFCADRPYLLMMRDRKSGCLLFVGIVVDPHR